ncbi:hypothetical protein Tsubulata_018861 [Turnera subulata]|uniref:Uncharacterized protein n=1 Tax=Turnera subulata TaxID=218843 RepID=A0A9Q0FLU3_9ROSI|nr:hypothetical protein Tsubulata_018861 [Turnera subulata]
MINARVLQTTNKNIIGGWPEMTMIRRVVIVIVLQEEFAETAGRELRSASVGGAGLVARVKATIVPLTCRAPGSLPAGIRQQRHERLPHVASSAAGVL